MKDFRQLCPSCKQTLELPLSASGKLAQCPACATTFTAREKPSQTTVDPASSAQLADENASVNSVAKETEQESHPEPIKPQDPGEPLETAEPPVGTANREPAHAANPGLVNPISSGLVNPISSGLVNPISSGLASPISSGLASPVNQPISSAELDNNALDNNALDNNALDNNALDNNALDSAAHDSSALLSAAEESAARKTDNPENPTTPLEDTGQHEASAAETAKLPPNQLYSEDRNPFSQPLLQKSVVTEPSSFFVNSNEISNRHFAERTQITIVSCSTIEIFKTTWAIMLDRGLLLLASLLLSIFLIAFTLITGGVANWILSLFISDAVMFIVYRAAITLVCTLATILLCRNAIGVARNTRHLMSDSWITFRSLLSTVVPATLIFAVASYYKWQLMPMYTIDFTVIVMIGLCTTGTLGWFWSSVFLCSDMQCSGFKSLVTAAQIFYHNKLSTLALISACTGLMLMGFASTGILLIVAVPFVQLLLATSYLMMTNQPFANPRHRIATDETT